MNKSFLLNPGYRLTGKEYTGLVKKFSTTIPYSLLGTETIQNRFISLIDDSYRKQSDSDSQLYVIPSSKHADLIIAYGNVIVRLEGKVPEEYFSVVFNTVKKIPLYMPKQYSKSELHILSQFITTMMNIAKAVPRKRDEIYSILVTVISQLLEDQSKDMLLYPVLSAFSNWDEYLPFSPDSLMNFASSLLEPIHSLINLLHQSKGNDYLEVSQRLSVFLTIEAHIYISIQNSTVHIDKISPDLSTLYEYAKSILSKPTHSKLTVACFRIYQSYSFLCPETAIDAWETIWKGTMHACHEKTLKIDVAVEGFHILSSLCPYIDSFTSCLANLPDLLKNTNLSTSFNESGSVFLRKSKRTKERIPIKYAIWRYKEIIEALIQFIKAVVECETKRGVFNSSQTLNTSVTKKIIDDISLILPTLTINGTESSVATDIRLYCKWIIDLSTSIVNIVNNSVIREKIYQIMVNCLDGNTPSMIVLPCLVQLSLIEGDKYIDEINSLLTSLLMKFDLLNYQEIITEVPKAMKQLIAGVSSYSMRQHLQNKFLVSCSQLCKSLLTIEESTEMHSLQRKISESIINVLSILESRWDPYKPQVDVESSIVNNYLDVWFHLVTIKSLSAESWTGEGEQMLSLFAAKSPLFHKHFIDSEKKLEFSAMSASQAISNAQPIRAALINRLGDKYAKDISYLNYSNALYLLTVYEVESRRAKQLCTVKAIFSYFSAIDSIENSFYPVMKGILEVIFKQFVDQLSSMERSEMTERILEDHMEFLLVQLCHRYVILQDISLIYICQLLENFPFLKTNAICLNILIKCILTIRRNLQPLDDAPVILHADEIRVLKDDQPLHYEMSLPYRSDKLDHLYSKILILFSTWLNCEETGLEEEVLITLQNIASPEVFSFIYNLIMDDETIKNHYTPFTDFLTSVRVHSLSEKIDFWSGQLRERLHIMSMNIVLQGLHDELKSFLKSKRQSSCDDNEQLCNMKSVSYQVTMNEEEEDSKPIDFLYKCASLVHLQRESTDPIIIQYICWLPGLLMDRELFKEAIEIWRWLLAEIPLFHSLIIKEICSAWHFTRLNNRGIFCVSDCWNDSHSRWFNGGIHHEETNQSCCCGCHCGQVFNKVNTRFQHNQQDLTLDSIDMDLIEENEEDICISPVQFRDSKQQQQSTCLCSHCCHCIEMKEDGIDIREKEIPHISLFYAPPTFLRELCGVTAFSSSMNCPRVDLEECLCHGLWLGFFDEVLGAYADRYEDIIREISCTLFTSLQQELTIESSCMAERFDFLICCWKSYELCKKYSLFTNEILDTFYSNIILSIINVLVYDNQDYNVLLCKKREKVDKLETREILKKMLSLYDYVQEIHLKSKETIRSKRLIKKKTSQQQEEDNEDNEEKEDIYSTSLLYQSLQKRNGLICHDQQLSYSHILDSQSLLAGSKGVIVDHLTVLTSTNSSSTIRFEELCLILLRGVMERLSLQISPCQNRWTLESEYTTQGSRYSINQWKEVMQLCSLHSAECTILLVHLYPHITSLRTELSRMICENPSHYIHCPEAVLDYILDSSDVKKKWLLYWTTPSLPTIVATMSRNTADYKKETPPMSNPSVMLYLTQSLGKFPPESLCFYLPQFVQGLRHDKTNKLQDYIIVLCSRNILLTHQLLWALITESEQESKQVNKYGFSGNPLSGKDTLPQICQNIIDRIKNGFSSAQALLYRQQFDFFNKLINISGLVKPLKKEERKAEIMKYVSEMREGINKKYLYLPTNPDYHILDIVVDSAAAMQSAGKAPYLLQFIVEKWDGPDSVVKLIEKNESLQIEPRIQSRNSSRHIDRKTINQFYLPISRTNSTIDPFSYNRMQSYHTFNIHTSQITSSTNLLSPTTSIHPLNDLHLLPDTPPPITEKKEEPIKMGLILKAYDDCRQDSLALQVMHLLETIWEAEGIDIPLMVYNVTPARTSDEHKAMGGIIECVPNSDSRDNLIKKGYETLKSYFEFLFGREDSEKYEMALPVACYILWVKDRHNGNLMFDTSGNLIHIDFGFLLGTSPGGNLGFETAAFKFSTEMYELLGGSEDAYPLQEFFDLTVEAFLCIRKYWKEICNVINCMSDSGLPCFLPDTLVNLKNRFGPNDSEITSAKNMLARSKDSIMKWTTKVYDGIQNVQNGIAY